MISLICYHWINSQFNNIFLIFRANCQIFFYQFKMIQNLHSYYDEIITKKLENGHTILLDSFKNQDLLLKTLQLIADNQCHSKNKFHILILLKFVIQQTWQLQQYYPNIKNDVRSALLHGLVQNHENLKLVQGYAYIIKHLIQKDGANQWIEPLKQLIGWMETQQIKIIQAGLQFFLVVFQQTINTELYKLADSLLSLLFNIFAHQLNQIQREKVLILVLLVIKTFSSFDGNKDEIVQSCFKGSYDIWMSLFISALQSKTKTHINMKRYILKSLTIIFRDMIKYSTKSLTTCILPIWQFCYKIISIYVWNVIFNLPISKFQSQKLQSVKQQQIPLSQLDILYLDQQQPQSSNPIELLAHQCIEMLSTIISLPALTPIINLSIYHIMSALFHYMLLTSFQVSNWQTNTYQFIAFSHNTQQSPTLRQKILGIINQLIQRYGDGALQGLISICQKFLLGGDNVTIAIQQIYGKLNLNKFSLGIDQNKLLQLIKQSSYNMNCKSYDWRKVQVVLSVLARFSEDIIVYQSKGQSSFDIHSFFLNLIDQINNPNYNPILRGTSLLCMTRYCEIISIKFRDLLQPLFKTSLNCCSQKNEIPVRMIGIKSLNIFGRKLQKHKIQISFQTFNKFNIVDQILSIQPNSQTITIILEGLIQMSKFNQAQKIAQNSQSLLNIFHQYNSSNTIYQLLSTLLTNIITVKINRHHILQQFGSFFRQCIMAYTKVISTSQKLQIRQYDIQLMNKVLKLVNLFIINCKQQTFNIVNLIPNMLKKNQDTSVHVEATICLKSFIKIAPQQIIKRDFVKEIIEIINSLIQIPKQKSFETASLYSGNLIILAFNNLLNGIADLQILKQVVLKVFKSRTPSIIQSLVLVYARLINNCGEGSNLEFNKEKLSQMVDFLSSFSFENRMALKILIDKWLLQQSLFRGKFAKNSTFMALSKLFMLKDKKIDNLLVIGFNPSHTNLNSDVYAPLKILSTLIRCLDNQCSRDNQDKNFNQQSFEDQQVEIEKDNQQVQVSLDKFVEDRQDDTINIQRGGGLGDRENQGSTCYMSAMLQFYDDGQECDQTTEQDLDYLKDCSTTFVLADYLKKFFHHLLKNDHEHFVNCLKHLLKEDLNMLNRYIKIKL